MLYNLSTTSCPPRGPKDSKIFVLGEAPGADEIKARAPFVGASGRELEHWFSPTEARLNQCYITNVVKERPPNNDIENFCVSKKEAEDLSKGLFGNSYSLQPLRAGKYLRPDLAKSSLEMLKQELLEVKPNVVLALGNTALWALTQTTGISKFRGAVCVELLTDTRIKVLPSYHPAAVLRQFDLRGVAVADTIKAVRESASPEINQTNRKVYIPESLAELKELVNTKLNGDLLCFDIETKPTQITCIGYAVNHLEAVVIPFYDPRKPDRSYWTFPDELEVWKIVDQLQRRATKKLTQNGLYDTQYLWRVMGIPTFGEVEDTMMIHHSLYPEMEKSLGFMGSLYTDQGSWKQMRPRGTQMEGKSDE